MIFSHNFNLHRWKKFVQQKLFLVASTEKKWKKEKLVLTPKSTQENNDVERWLLNEIIIAT